MRTMWSTMNSGLSREFINGVQTKQMCCICFAMVPVGELWKDKTGQKWDLCSDECANQAGAE